MNYFEIIKKYEERGLTKYKLNTIEDFEEIYGIKIDLIKGYADLSMDQQCLFRIFLLNYLNGIGLDLRMSFVPTSIHYVLEVQKYGKFDDDDCLYQFARIFYIVEDSGRMTKMRGKNYEDKKINYSYIEKEERSFLRFDFKENGYKYWLHVMGPRVWY